jgi:hypothetical protein
VVTITASTAGPSSNGFIVVVSSTTITTTATNMAGGADVLVDSEYNQWMWSVRVVRANLNYH